MLWSLVVLNMTIFWLFPTRKKSIFEVTLILSPQIISSTDYGIEKTKLGQSFIIQMTDGNDDKQRMMTGSTSKAQRTG